LTSAPAPSRGTPSIRAQASRPIKVPPSC
jgi:hypothetical protein